MIAGRTPTHPACSHADATSKSIYGPYTMGGAVIDTAKIAPEFRIGDNMDVPALGGGSVTTRARAAALAATAAGPAPAAGDLVVLYNCSATSTASNSWATKPVTLAAGAPLTIHPSANSTLCITAENSGGDATHLSLQICGSSHGLVQHFSINATASNGDDINGIGGCPCWNVQDNSARAKKPHAGADGMPVQCYSCVDGTDFNPNQRFTLAPPLIKAWSGYAAGFCVASVPKGSTPTPPPPPGPQPWYMKEVRHPELRVSTPAHTNT